MSLKKMFENNFFIIKMMWKVDKKFFLLFVFRTLFSSLEAIIQSFILKNIIAVIENHGTFREIIYNAALMAMIFGIERLFAYISTRTKDIASVKFSVYMNCFIYDKISCCELEDFENPQWNNDLNNALSVNQDALSTVSVLIQFISSVISTITTAIILFAYKWYLCVFVILAALLSSLMSAVNKKNQYNYIIDSSKDRRESSYYPSILFNGEYAKERKIFGYSGWLIDKYKHANSVIIKKLKALCIKFAGNLLLTNAVSNLLSVAIIIIVGCEAVKGDISIASFSLYTSLFASFSDGIRNFLNTYVDLQEKSLYLNYLTDFLSKIENKRTFAGSEPVTRSGNDTIEFRNVCFKYPSEEKYTLKNINFSFGSNEKICLVGVNGAGKTTLIKLLVGLYVPTEGEILYNGVNIQNLNITEYRNLFSTCFQDFRKYSFTVSENLIFNYGSEQSDKEVTEALKKVGLFDKINGFPNTIHTPLTRYYEENGKELSGGEWQKLSLARALLYNRAFLILDEPTSNLDAIAENDFFGNLEKNVTESGIMFVSHRLSSAKISDKIIVIDGGEIKESGSHDELMRKDGFYSKLFKMQSERYE